jgi:hypothetical protein
VESGPKSWEQQDGEPDLWYRRFHEHYLLKGGDRSVDAAWREYDASRPDTGRAKVRKAPYQWTKAAIRYEWVTRARAWDDQERVSLRKARLDAIEAANRKHQIVWQNMFGKLAQRIKDIDFSKLSPSETVRLAEVMTKNERLVLGAPVSIEETRTRGAQESQVDLTGVAAVTAADIARFELNPDLLAGGLMVLQTHETRPEPDPEPQADDPPDDADQTSDSSRES